jgi:hypothetical protein
VTAGVQLALPSCALPGCRVVVAEPGDVCPGCRAAFGDYLAPVERDPEVTAEEVAARYSARDDVVRAVYAARQALTNAPVAGPETRRNQRCWICEERHTCTRTPQGWECPTCQTIT